MKRPQVKYKSYTISYIQVPYEDRFFVVEKNDKEMFRISGFYREEFFHNILQIFIPEYLARHKFSEKVDKYDAFLDETDE